MPQAIERSLATPMMRPRLPAISGPGLAISVFVMTFFQSWCCCAAWAHPLRLLGLATLRNSGWSAAAASRTRMERVPLRVASLHHQSRIGAAEAEAVRHYTVKVGVVLPFSHDGDICELRIQLLDVGAFANEAA